jgi:parallel beta-helix repeat protein
MNSKGLILGTICLLVGILVLAAGTVWAGTINVDANNTACVTGHQADPYSVVYCNIQDAVTDAAANDIIDVAAGTYNESITINTSVSLRGPNVGINPITGTRVPEAILTYAGRVILVNVDDVIIDGFKFENVTAGPAVIDVGTEPYVVVDNLIIRYNLFTNNYGPVIYCGYNPSCTGWLITDNKIDGTTGTNTSGLFLVGPSVTISGNWIGNTAYAGMILDGLTNSTVSSNTVYNVPQQGIQLAGASSNVTISNNNITNANTLHTADKGGIGIYGAAFTGTVNVTGNIVTNSFNGFAVRAGQNITGKDIHVYNNSLTGNTNKAVYHGGTGTLDASGNWYGTNTPAGMAVAVSANVDYTPWLHDGTDQSGDPGFQPDLSYLHVDDTSPQTGPAEYIEEGINMVTGSTIQVEAGTYEEQVYITKSLDLIGVGSKPVIQAPPAATRTTYNITESGRTFDPIIFADGGGGVIDVTVDNFEIDGNNDGGSNTFCGVLFRNTNPGVISNNDLHSLRGTGQETQGILMYGANTDVTVSGNTVTDFSRNGITANVDAQAAISGNTVTGDGPLPSGNWAQNGIQIGFGASGSITGNTITGCSIQDPGWAASGILAYQPSGTIQINGNTTTENEVNIYLGDCSANIEGNTVNATATGTGQTSFYGIIGDPGETKAPKPSVFGDLDGVSKPMSGTKVTYTVTCTDNIVESDGSAGGTGIGIYAGMYGTYDIDFTATGNTVRYWQWGFELYEYAPNNLISAEIHYNNIEGNTDYGIYNYLTETFDATNNWWGSVDGPKDLAGSDEAKLDECYDVSTIKNTVAEISGTLGNDVTEYVEYCPWLGGDAGFDAEIYAGCNDPCDDFCLDFKLSGTDVRFFHFEYPLPACIDYVSSSNTYGSEMVVWQTVMFGDVLHIDGSFDPNFTGANVKIGEICFTHDGSCPNTIQTLTCTYDEVLDGDGNTVDVSPGLAIINVDNTVPDKDHPTGNILPCYSASDDPDWTCWNLSFVKGGEEWQCDLLQATIRIYDDPLCDPGDLVFTHDFFTTTIPGDFNICYPTNQADRDAIWAAIYPTYGDGIYYVRLTVKDDCCNEANNCDAFTFCTDTYTDNYMTCLDAKPAHNHICLEWNYNFDATNAVNLQILRSPYRAGNYPEYVASDPVPDSANDPDWYKVYEGTTTYPCDQLTWFNDDGSGCVTGIPGSKFTDKEGDGDDYGFGTDDDARDIYWYAGFTQDAAGNWSSANMTLGTGADRATSYWLGDVAGVVPGPPDGKVFGVTGDVHRLSAAYGTTPASGTPPWDNTVDYGPESQEHGIGRGIPTPDDVINYKDLKPFSFNYNIVGPSGDCVNWPLPPETPPRKLEMNVEEIAAVWLKQVESNDPEGITFALMLTNPGDATHLFHSRISYDPDVLSLVEVRRGDVGISEGFAEFFRAPITGNGLVDVDLAALGPEGYLVGSGAVAYLDFSYESSEMASVVRLKEAILYDGEGNEVELSPTDVEVESQDAPIPAKFALHHNHPNPFNPTTTIKYDLPQDTHVKLVVYNVRGQKVATLVDGMVQAGSHQVMWNADDLSSGVYFYKITAGNFTEMRKMILLK